MHKDHFYKITSLVDGKTVPENKMTQAIAKGWGPLEVVYDYDQMAAHLNKYAIKNSPLSALKYLEFYPICDMDKVVTLNEGGTSLLHAKNLGADVGLSQLYIKHEGKNPTGVFKDRGSLVEITKAKELGASAVVVASTGNMAASVAAYSSLAGLPCYVLAPEGTPIGKLSQTLSYGARLLQIRGNYTDCARLAVKMALKYDYYLAGDYAFRMEGQKSQAYEIAEQLLFKSPDVVIAPVGCGTNLSAIWKGFQEFYRFGFIEKLPRIIGVQTPGCDTVATAVRAGRKKFAVVAKPNTLASAIAAGDPLDGIKVMRAIYDSRGTAMLANDDEVLEAEKALARREGVFVEPSAALPVAALPHLIKSGAVRTGDVVVCIATGTGLKDPKTVLRALPDPVSLEADINDIDAYLSQKPYNIRAVATSASKEKVLWRRLPTKAVIAVTAKKEFGVALAASARVIVQKDIEKFLAKGRPVTKGDAQRIIEASISAVPLKDRVLKVEDFEATTTKKGKARATVDFVFYKKAYTSDAQGDGAVDALIGAMRKVTERRGKKKIHLTDFDVTIDSGGADAVVMVMMYLEDEHKNKIEATAVSPDVIAASVAAYVKGYNLLAKKNGKR